MKSILDVLFSGELSFPGSWIEESKLGKEQDQIEKLEIQVKANLGEEQSELWKEYQKKAREMMVLQCRMEFERGFLLAANLGMEVFCRTAQGTE